MTDNPMGLPELSYETSPPSASLQAGYLSLQRFHASEAYPPSLFELRRGAPCAFHPHRKRWGIQAKGHKIMGALFAVHNELGPSLLEKYYQRAVAKELALQGLSFQQEVPVALVYKTEHIGKYFLDFIVEDKVILETKAQVAYSPKFFKQTLAYLKETGLPLAILVNFRRPRLEYKRIINSSYIRE